MLKTEYRRHRRLLIVDDQEINRMILGNIVSDYQVDYACDGAEALDFIRAHKDTLSAVLLDLIMPNTDGFEVLRIMGESPGIYGEMPVIVLTSEKDAELRALTLGASDFITKPFDIPEVILTRIDRIIELREGRDLINTASRDPISGLSSGQFFLKFCSTAQLNNPGLPMDVAVLNIRRFRSFNELYGRIGGNTLLKVIGNALSRFIENTPGVAARYEADIFYLFFPHTDDYNPLLNLINEALAEVPGGKHVKVRLGICPSTQDLPLAKRLDRARTAGNMLRGNYKNSIMIYDDELHKAEMRDEKLTNGIDQAVLEHQFVVYYQPKYAIQGGRPRLAGAEALIRWRHPDLGMISPGVFIPLFEEKGLIHIADRFVWQEGARQTAEWKKAFGISLPVSVNLSRVELFDEHLEQDLLGLIETNGLATEDLHLEITESAYTNDADEVCAAVGKLQNCGFKIEMDDFGSGYSSLNMLSTLPIDALKMDMKFIRNIRSSRKDFRIIELILDIAKYIGVPVIAEGVEDEDQLNLLKEAGCDIVQGYYFSKPVPPEDFEVMIKKEIELIKGADHDTERTV